jgi:hydrogenase maturation protease
VPAASLEIDGRGYESWQEASECEISLPDVHFAVLEAGVTRRRFQFPPTRTLEPIRGASGLVAGAIVRTQEPLEGWIEVRLEQPQDGLFRIRLRVSNHTPFDGASREGEHASGREGAIARSLLSAHSILRLRDGEFVSLLEPPAQFEKAAAACRNVGAWPVLAGEAGARDTVLSSPIILYDYPQIAPESPGDLFDGAEIDEILSLRILALTDEEKDAMRRADEHARQILERTETLPPEHFMKLHGVLRGVHPVDREAL